jgi:hypothetical protein
LNDAMNNIPRHRLAAYLYAYNNRAAPRLLSHEAAVFVPLSQRMHPNPSEHEQEEQPEEEQEQEQEQEEEQTTHDQSELVLGLVCANADLRGLQDVLRVSREVADVARTSVKAIRLDAAAFRPLQRPLGLETYRALETVVLTGW